MSIRLKILSIFLVIATVALILPQKLEARAPSETVDTQLAALSQAALSMAAGMINPALGGVFSNTEEKEAGDVSVRRNKPAVKEDNQPPAQYVTGQRSSGLDLDALIAASTESAKEGLLLVNKKNSWSTQPANHADMLKCVDQEGLREDGYSGAGVVNEVNQGSNIYGKSGNYTSYYDVLFSANTSGTWTFAVDSAGACEIEIDDAVAAAWYGEHAASGGWSHNGNVTLSAGWHRLVLRYSYMAGSPSARAAFKKPGDNAWSIINTSGLALKPVNLDKGLTLVTAKNTWSTYPANHADLVKCVDQDSTREKGWYGASIAPVLYQDKNIHGNNDHYTSYYEVFFYADTVGSWRFATDSAGASEVEIDGQAAVAWYGGHSAAGAWSHNGTLNLSKGWHHLIYRHAVVTGDHTAAAAFQKPGETVWRALHEAVLPLKGVCWVGVDGDNLPDSVEAVLGTDPQSMDTDLDLLDDWYEVKNSLDPLKEDSNDDGLNDYAEVTGVAADVDGDGIANAWDDDNDNDGVPDSMDISPFSKTGVNDSYHLDIKTSGNDTFVDFQLIPQNAQHLKLQEQTWDWPVDDKGSMQDLDSSKDDMSLIPMLELSMPQAPVQSMVSDYGILVSDTALKLAGVNPWSAIMKQGGLGNSNTGGGAAVADIDGNGKLDLLLMGIDNPEGANNFRYKIGWDMNTGGTPARWSNVIQVGGVGDYNEGGAAVLADINHNGKVDLLLMGIDSPQGANQFRYKIGWDLKADGMTASWSPMAVVAGMGDLNAGGGAAVGDIDGNGKLDLVLMGIDEREGPNQFRYKIGWDLAANGIPSRWSDQIWGPETARYTAGGGVQIGDIDGNGLADLVLTAVDASSGNMNSQIVVGWNLTRQGIPSVWSPVMNSPTLANKWRRVAGDLNYTVGGKYIYLCVKEDLADQIKTLANYGPQPPAGEGWTRLPGDLNEGADGVYIFLCVRDSLLGLIKVISGDSSDISPGAGWIKLPQDCNQGAEGKFVYICIKESLAGRVKVISGDSVDIAPEESLSYGGGLALADINGNGRMDLLLAGIEDVWGSDEFHYQIGWDLGTSSQVYVPLLPVLDNGKTAALGGRLYYPATGKATDILAEAKLVWMANAKSDMTGLTWGDMKSKGGLGWDNSGGGSAIADINGNGKPDLLLMGIDAAGEADSFRYVIGWDTDGSGQPASWSPYYSKGGLGWDNSGGGAAIADINGNGKPDLLLMGIDNPEGGDSFRYVIGWDLNTSGNPAGWSPILSKSGLGVYNAGGGAAIYDINGNGRPDLLLAGIDNPEGGDSFRYIVGWDMDTSGNPAGWSPILSKSGLGVYNAGGGAAIADMNGNGRPDLLLMGIDNPEGGDSFRYLVGWDMDTGGNPADWSPILSKSGLGVYNAGGGAAIADINGDGKLDILLMGIDNPEGSNSFRYFVGSDIGPETKTVARYPEAFMLSGLAVEEDFGCEAGLFYSADTDQTVRAYMALRYEFLNSHKTVAQARAQLPGLNITVNSNVKQFAQADAMAKAVTGEMIKGALDGLPVGKRLPVALAMTSTSSSESLDGLVSGSYILGNSCQIDMTAVPQTTWKSIKLPWYNTTTSEQLEDEEILLEVDDWNWSPQEKANITLVLLPWSNGEVAIIKMGDISVPAQISEAAARSCLQELSRLTEIMEHLRHNAAFPVIDAVMALMIGVPAVMQYIQTKYISIVEEFTRIDETIALTKPEHRGDLYEMRAEKVKQSRYVMRNLVNNSNPLNQLIKGSFAPQDAYKDTTRLERTQFRWFKVSQWRWHQVLRIMGRVMIVASVLAIIAEFFYIAGMSGWSKSGWMTAGLYAIMSSIYLAIIIGISLIPMVGWAIVLVILLVDMITSLLGYGSAWVMEQIVNALTDYDLRSQVNQQTQDTWLDIQGYADGLTAGDRIELTSNILTDVTRTGEGNDWDVKKSYLSPAYHCRVPDSSESGWYSYPMLSQDWGSSRWVVYHTGAWVKPAVGTVNYPLTVWVRAEYRIDYDETVAGVSSEKKIEESRATGETTLYFDVLPSTLDEFLSWSAITCTDSDGDNLKDAAEAGTGALDTYRMVNKSSGLSLAEAGTTENSQAELAVNQGGNNQQWWLMPYLQPGQKALKAHNGKYVKLDPAYWDIGANGANITDGLKLYLVEAGKQAVVLKTEEGRYITMGSSGGLYKPGQIGGEMLPEMRFTVEYLDGGNIALKASNGKYVTVLATGGSVVNELIATADVIGDKEKFTLEQSGYYRVSATDNKVLSIIDGSSTAGAKVTLKTYGYNSDQNWWLENAGGGYYRLVNRRSGLCLGIYGSGVAGADAVQETYTGADDQKWKLEPVRGISNKAKWDTDADGLPDGFEIRNYVDYGTKSTLSDTDNDGLNDKLELDLGTDPTLMDTDSDNLSDKAEAAGWRISFTYNGKAFSMNVWSDPLMVDSDGDGLTDYQEYRNGFNPRSRDTDGDGILDPDEAGVKTTVAMKPMAADEDSDGDGLSDVIEQAGWTITYTDSQGSHSGNVTSELLLADSDFDGLNDGEEHSLLTNPGNVDTDADGLTDAEEKSLGTSGVNYDTDGDGLDDGHEAALGSDPLVTDTDNDGLSDPEEYELGSSPLKADTDNDGLSDLQEKQYGTSPNNPDTDKDLLADGQEIQKGTDPLKVDTDADGIKDGEEVRLETNPLSNDSDGDGLKDGEEVELWTDPLNTDSDKDGLTDYQEEQDGTNPLSADSDHDGMGDKEDPDSYAANPAEIYVLYDKGEADYSQFIKGLGQYSNVISGNLTDIPDYQSKAYVVILGYPEDKAGTAAKVTHDLLTEDVRNNMLGSDLYRLVRGINVWEGNKLLIMLSKPYQSDYYRVLASIKSLKYEITGNSVTVTYPENKKKFFIEAIKEVDFYINVELINRVTPTVTITRYNSGNPLLAEVKPLTQGNGLGAGEMAVGKYMEIGVSDNGQSGNYTNIKQADFKIYYTGSELDRTGPPDGDSTDAGDIDENTLNLYRYNEAAKVWEKVTGNETGVDAANVQLYNKAYEGYVWEKSGHLSLYGLAGKTIPPVYVIYPPAPQPVVTSTPTTTPTPTSSPTATTTATTSTTPAAATQAPVRTTPATTLPGTNTMPAATTPVVETTRPSPALTTPGPSPVKTETPVSAQGETSQENSQVWLVVGIILAVLVVIAGPVLTIRFRKKPRKK